jgi:hypothetical protein
MVETLAGGAVTATSEATTASFSYAGTFDAGVTRPAVTRSRLNFGRRRAA